MSLFCFPRVSCACELVWKRALIIISVCSSLFFWIVCLSIPPPPSRYYSRALHTHAGVFNAQPPSSMLYVVYILFQNCKGTLFILSISPVFLPRQFLIVPWKLKAALKFLRWEKPFQSLTIVGRLHKHTSITIF